MIFIMSNTPPKEDGYYWALLPARSFLGNPETPVKWEPVEMDGGTIWIMGSDVPAVEDWVELWKWGPKLQLPVSPVKEET